MLDRYGGDLNRINAAWGTEYVDPAEIALPEVEIPHGIEAFRADEPTAPGTFDTSTPQRRRRWLDFIAWYRGAMNDLASIWMTTTRRLFPDHPIYLCTGGDAPPQQGAHFGDQCRIAASVGGGVRITNEDSRYAHNFAITRWVTSAGRFHGAYTGIEPAGGVNEFGVTCRIFNAVASGAKNLHFYAPNIVHHRATIDAWNANFGEIRLESPVLDVAFLHPDTSIMLGLVPTNQVFRQVSFLRDLTDLDYVDDDMVGAGALDRYRVLLMAHATVVEQATLDRIDAWLANGGVLVLLGESDRVGRRPGLEPGRDDRPGHSGRAFGSDPGADANGRPHRRRARRAGPAVGRWKTGQRLCRAGRGLGCLCSTTARRTCAGI